MLAGLMVIKTTVVAAAAQLVGLIRWVWSGRVGYGDGDGGA